MIRVCFCLIPLALLAASDAAAQTADLAVRNARIYTLDARQPSADFLAARDGKLIYVGPGGEQIVARYVTTRTAVLDAKGATVIPGLIDSHGHVRGLGESLDTINLRGVTSESEIAAKVATAAKTAKPGGWIRGRAWDQNLWQKKDFPTAESISAAAPDYPVFLTRVDGHAAWVNRKALELADINAATEDPPGGKIIRDRKGQPTGVLVDRAQALVSRKIPPAKPAEVEHRIALALQECARLGLTTVHDAGVGQEEMEAYHRLAAKNAMPIRAYVMIGGEGRLLDRYLARGPEIGDYLTVRSIKLYADGALGSRGAALLEPYSDDPGNRGILITDGPAIRRVAQEAIPKGFQVNTHAIGDRANRIVLQAYREALHGKNDLRFRVEHAQIIAPEDFELFQRYSVIASMQATHATSDMPWAESRIGKKRLEGAYAWQTFLQRGVHLANGSDFPVEEPNPMFGLFAAITRQTQDGTPPDGWFPHQRLSREEALRSWTIEGAYAAFEENRKGSLEKGKDADFVLLSGDIMTMPASEIWKTRVITTVVGGKVVFQSK